jgi:hypothetical protein
MEIVQCGPAPECSLNVTTTRTDDMKPKNLSPDCRLYHMVTEKFMRLAPSAVLRAVHIMGDGSINIGYEHEGETDKWSIDIICLVEATKD